MSINNIAEAYTGMLFENNSLYRTIYDSLTEDELIYLLNLKNSKSNARIGPDFPGNRSEILDRIFDMCKGSIFNSMLYRGVREDYAEPKVGSSIELGNYLSFSQDRNEAKKFATDHRYILCLRSSIGGFSLWKLLDYHYKKSREASLENYILYDEDDHLLILREKEWMFHPDCKFVCEEIIEADRERIPQTRVIGRIVS